jgi:hypothetical protein
MTSESPAEQESTRVEKVERMLTEHGHELRFTPIRVAVARTGIAVGFPEDPMFHVSWWVLLAPWSCSIMELLHRHIANPDVSNDPLVLQFREGGHRLTH